MARDSTNGYDPQTQWGRLSERVEHQGRDLVDLRSNMNTGFQNVQAALSSLTSELRGTSKTQWPVIWSAIGVSFTVLAAVGTLAYWPVLSNQTRLETAMTRMVDTIGAVSDRSLSRDEANWRAARIAEDRTRVDNTLAGMLPRKEWEERNLNRDHEIAAVRESHTRANDSLQRQIDQQRADFQTFSASLGNGRDFIRDLKDEQDRLRDQLSELRALLRPVASQPAL